ncbi:MAG: hypothetical protein ABI954_08540 [Pyrinomonadaceae bacterium]
MPNETNQGKENKTTTEKSSGSSSSGTGVGMQVSGEEIFLPEDKQPKVTQESDMFGKQASDQQNTATQPSQSNDPAQEVSKKVGQVLSGDTKPVTDAFNQAKNVAGAVAGQAYEQAQEKAGSILTEQKQSLAQGLGGVADNIRKFGADLGGENSNQITATAAKYGDSLAEQIENLSGYLESGDFRTFARDLKSFARRNPTAFVIGAFGLGILAARFIKSSPAQAPAPTRSRRRNSSVSEQGSRSNTSDQNAKPIGDKPRTGSSS